MAELAFNSTPGSNGQFTVERSVASGVIAGSVDVVVVIDNTVSKQRINESLRAAMRAINRQMGKASQTADIPTSGSSSE